MDERDYPSVLKAIREPEIEDEPADDFIGFFVDYQPEFGTFAFGGGFKRPVYVSSELEAVVKAIPESQSHQSFNGRMHDLFWMAFNAVMRSSEDLMPVMFQMIMHRIENGRMKKKLFVVAHWDAINGSFWLCLPDDRVDKELTKAEAGF